MDVAKVISKMHHAGFTLSANGDRLSVSPSDRLTDQQRDYLRRHKAELLAALLDGSQPGNDIGPANDHLPASIDSLPLRLRAAATRVCLELHNDPPEAIEAMLEELRHYPPDSYPALIRHFEMQLPDDDYDNRRTCRDCLQLSSTGNCRAAQRGEIPTAVSTWRPDPERLRRCVGYRPKAHDSDPRHGLARWPGLDLAPGIAPINQGSGDRLC